MRRLLPAVLALAACGPSAPAPPPVRADAAGDPLPPWAVARIGTARFLGPCAGCALSADGKSVIAACDDGFVTPFDATTGSSGFDFPAHTDVVKPEREGALPRLDAMFSDPGPAPDGIQLAAFSADGTRLVTGGGPALRLWDVATATKLAEHVRAGASQAIAFAPDGKTIRVADFDRLWSWDPAAGTFLETPVRFSQFGFLGMLATRDAAVARPAGTAPNPNGAVVTDVATGAQVSLAVPFFAAGCGESPDGSRIAVFGTSMGNERKSPLVVCDATTGAALVSTTVADSCWGRVGWSPDGRTIAFSGSFAGVHLLDASTLAPLRTIPVRMAPVAAFSTDGKRLLVDSWSGPRLLDVATGDEVGGPFVRLRGWGIRWTEDGRRVAAPLEDGRIGVFDAETGVVIDRPAALGPGYFFDRRGGVVAAADVPSEVAKEEFVSLCAFERSDGPRVVAFRSSDGTVIVRDGGSGRELRRNASRVAVSPAGTRIATTTTTGSIVLTDVDSDADLATWTPSEAASLALAEEFDGVATVEQRAVVVLAAGRATPLRRWEIDSRWSPTAVALSWGGRRVAAVVGWSVVVWDVDSGDELVRLAGHRAPPSDLEFSPNGTRLASSAADGTALVWALPLPPR